MKLNSSNVYYKKTSYLRRPKHWNSLQEKQGISISEGLMEVKLGQIRSKNTCQKGIDIADLFPEHSGGLVNLLKSLPTLLIIVLWRLRGNRYTTSQNCFKYLWKISLFFFFFPQFLDDWNVKQYRILPVGCENLVFSSSLLNLLQ